MSTYIDPRHPNRHDSYDDIPYDVVQYLHYLEVVKARSPRTSNGYYIDLRNFFRFLVRMREHLDLPLEEISIVHLNTEFYRLITKAEIYEYIYYLQSDCGNGKAAITRKLASIHGFFHYMVVEMSLLETDPSADISGPPIKQALPKYLSLDESIELLNNIQSDFYERDFCIITLFLNCGMRLTELVSMNLNNFKDGTIRIMGKGHKERLVYLNSACSDALEHYLAARAQLLNIKDTDKNALFISKRTGRRLTPRRVEQIVERCLQTAGLSGKGYSPHKLRHTAATLMYRHGNVDMLTLKEILGHESVSTTQIYTHINTQKLQDAAQASPLSKMKFHAEKHEKIEETNSNASKASEENSAVLGEVPLPGIDTDTPRDSSKDNS